jgi:L-amino acid N-acyltransferase YncA
VPAPQSSIKIRRATVADAAAILEIYNHEVQFETSTFDLVPRTLEAQQAWISARSGAFSAIVAIDEPTLCVGFGALSEYRDRAAYKTSVENSVYVKTRSCALRNWPIDFDQLAAASRRLWFSFGDGPY